MLTEDSFNAVPADAACEVCRHFAVLVKSGKYYCEFLDRRVQPRGWCPDFEPTVDEYLRRKKAGAK